MKVLKILLWILGSVFFLVIIAVVLTAFLNQVMSPKTPDVSEDLTMNSVAISTQPDQMSEIAQSSSEYIQTTEEEKNETQKRAEEILNGMTQREKLCQLLVISPDTITGVSPTTVAGDRTREAIEAYPVGGFSFGQNNIENRDQISQMLAGMNEMSKIGPFFCIDEEGGTVWRVMGNDAMGTTWVEDMFSYKDDGAATAYENAKTIAADIHALGFNVDFAPVADVWSNPDNTVIGTRAYSDDFAQAAELIPAAVQGFHDGSIICSLKHFPGHGSTTEDSHSGMAYVYRSEQQLAEEDLLPFQAGIDAGADMVMIGHLMVPSLDEEHPASLSYPVVTGLLREKLGFQGVIITDNLRMGALNNYSEAEKAVMALQAGCDILLGLTDMDGVLEGLQDAIDRGVLPQSRIDESVLRILSLKLTYGIE